MKHLFPLRLPLVYKVSFGLLAVSLCWFWFQNRSFLRENSVQKRVENIHQVAWVFANKGKLKKAHDLFEESSSLCRETLGISSPLTLTSLNNLAWTKRYLGNFVEALELFQEVKELRESVLGLDHSDSMTTRINLASLHLYLGDMEQAEAIYLENLQRREDLFEDEHPDLLSSMVHLGAFYQRAGQFEKAEPLLAEAAEKHLKVLGGEDKATLYALDELGVLYMKQEAHAKAQLVFRQILSILESESGPEHLDALRVRETLGGIHRHMGQMEEAVALQESALAGRQRILGYFHSLVASSHYNLGLSYERMPDPSKALESFTQAYQIGRQQFGGGHPWTKEALHKIYLLRQRSKVDTAAVQNEKSSKPLAENPGS